MGKYKFGYKSLKISDIDPATGLAADGTAYELKEDVYRDSFNIVEEEGTVTDEYSEMDPDPKISFTEQGKTNLTLSIMDTTVETLKLLKGGEVVIADGKKTWSKPRTNVQIEKYIEMETADGQTIIVPRGKLMARYNNEVRRNGIALLDVTITVLVPEVEDLAPIDFVEVDPNYEAP